MVKPLLWSNALSLILLATNAQAQSQPKEDQRELPHIIFILIDDFGWADASWHREPGYSEVQSPNMHALLESGIELDRNYVHKFCSPTRSAIQSGRNPIHVNANNFAMTRFDPKNPLTGISGVAVNMTGFAQRLSEAGYKHRSFAGKWDAGMAYHRQTPMGRGYTDALFYFNHDNDYWSFGKTPDDGGCTLPGETGVARDLFGTNPDGTAGPQYHLANAAHCWLRPDGNEAGYAHPFPNNMSGCAYEDDIFTNFTVRQIMEHDDQSGPLLAFHSAHSIHAPLEVVPDAYDKFSFIDYDERRRYHAMVWNVDRAIGHIVDALKTKGLYEKALIVLSADNGGPIYRGGGANNFPLKGGKASNWEGGIRVNGIVSGGFLPKPMRGKKLDGLVAGWDWYATFVHGIAGLDPTDEEAKAAGLPPIDSVDQWPYLSGQSRSPPRTELPFGTSKDPTDIFSTRSNQIEVHTLIQADPPSGHLFKLQVGIEPFAVWSGPQTPNASEASLPPPSFVHLDCGFDLGCLFDLTADPTEQTDVASAHPAIVKRMRQSLSKHNATVWAPYRPNDLAKACAVVTTKYKDPSNAFGWWGPFAENDGNSFGTESLLV